VSTLAVLAFDTEQGADQTRDALGQLQRQHLITLDDAAVVARSQDGKVKVRQATNLVGTGALGGAFWGMLVGLLFLAPWLGAAVGAISGAIVGKMSDYGIDDNFIKEVGNSIQPGNSALFLLVREATVDRVVAELRQYNPRLVQTNLSQEDEAKPRAALGAEQETVTQPDICRSAQLHFSRGEYFSGEHWLPPR
jgi:uncharacterized membrane protein